MDKITVTYRSFDPIVYIVEIPSGVDPEHFTGYISIGIENMQIKIMELPIADVSVVGKAGFSLMKIGDFQDCNILEKLSLIVYNLAADVKKFSEIAQEAFLSKSLL